MATDAGSDAGPASQAQAAGGPGDQSTEPQVQHALAYLVRSTANRPQTEAELAGKLRSRDYEATVLEEALARAREGGVVDDAAFARAWVDDRGQRRGFGVARLRRELRNRQVPEPLIDDALSALDGRDELAVATELARERLGQLPASLTEEATARRLYSYLGRRGYSEPLARRVALAVSGADRDWD